MQKIDFVLPWVDGNNQEWQNTKKKYLNPNEKDSDMAFRFRDMNTFQYVLRSIEKNCPWYNKIHIITWGHYPEWLNIDHPKINLITEKELYFNKEHLPIFSASSLEMNLANMQGVSEQFVYLNDDMIILNELKIERFFQNGKPVDFLSHGWLSRNKLFAKLRGINTWIHALNNSLNLINKKFSPLKFENKYLYHPSYNIKNKFSNFLLQNLYKKFIWIEHWHHPQPYLMSTLKEVYKEFQQEMMACSANKFRAKNDLTAYIYRYWQLANQAYVPYKFNDGIEENIKTEKQLKKILLSIKDSKKTVNFVCFNDADGIDNNEYIMIKTMLIEYLENIFSEPSCFEITTRS